MNERLFKYQSVAESEEQMLDDLFGFLADASVERHLMQRFSLAVSEAFTNALTHGNRRNPEKLITIRLSVNETTLTADISDQGEEGISRISAKQSPDLLSESGRGIDLIRHYASSVSFSETETGGLRVTIRMDREVKMETRR